MSDSAANTLKLGQKLRDALVDVLDDTFQDCDCCDSCEPCQAREEADRPDPCCDCNCQHHRLQALVDEWDADAKIPGSR